MNLPLSSRVDADKLIHGAPRTDWARKEIKAVYELPFNDLLFLAHQKHRMNFDPNRVQLSTLLNIKSGGCAEDCKYCAQSSRYQTGLSAQKLMDMESILDKAKVAKKHGAERFCMGAAWRDIKPRDLPRLVEIISAVKNLELETCATLGMADLSDLQALKDAGLDYYNHNIDTSEEFYPEIVTTRTFEDRLNTLDAVRKAGLKVCCGGILGLGEAIADRISMLHTLASLPEHPQSFPVNLLVPIEGTPLAGKPRVDAIDLVRFIATSRLVMPATHIRLSAGRNDMTQSEQAMCFFAGANSIFYGEELLTTPNFDALEDHAMFKILGIRVSAE